MNEVNDIVDIFIKVFDIKDNENIIELTGCGKVSRENQRRVCVWSELGTEGNKNRSQCRGA